jgi:DNA invertase Pin-like site-specific DNA recombinase
MDGRTILVRAAEYVRMSTDTQQTSIAVQRAAIADYAEKNGLQVVRSYADEGKSGVTTKHRDALKTMLKDVVGGEADYQVLLVYDVSRWGRFQDSDEAAHYEFLCRSNGVQVIYCAELFPQDATPFAAVLKNLKRAMAGEYSRELSAKVSAAKRRLVLQGYYPGGPTPLALRRLMVDEHGQPRAQLERGERKSLQSHHCIYVWGPDEEVALVRRIFSLFLDDRLSYTEICGLLNSEGLKTPYGRRWSKWVIHNVLCQEKYIGTLVVNRWVGRLGKSALEMPPDQWIRVEGAIEPIIERRRFEAVQAALQGRSKSDEKLLSLLKAVLEEHGRVTPALMKAAKLPAPNTYAARFGSLLAAYRLIGYTPPPGRLACVAARYRLSGPAKSKSPSEAARRDEERRLIAEMAANYEDGMLEHLRVLLKRHGRLSGKIIADAGSEGVPSVGAYLRRYGTLQQAYQLVGYELEPWRLKGLKLRTRRIEQRELAEAIARAKAAARA